jgi:hypothetical protein
MDEGHFFPMHNIFFFGPVRNWIHCVNSSPCWYVIQIANVWSCGLTLYVMLVSAYPFEDPGEPKNFRKTIHVICSNLQVISLALCYYRDWASLLWLTKIFGFFFSAYNQCPVLDSRLCSYISRVPSSDLKDFCGWAGEGG